jgi:hypothetical protein
MRRKGADRVLGISDTVRTWIQAGALTASRPGSGARPDLSGLERVHRAAVPDERGRHPPFAGLRQRRSTPTVRSYFASPSCFMNSWLSQKSHSWSIVPPFQWPIVTMPR